MLRSLILAAAAVAAAGPASAQELLQDAAGDCAEPLPFNHVLTSKPIPLYKEGEITPAVEEFHCTGENPYSGDATAIEEGKGLYNPLCAGCHMPDGTGRMGPNLVDGTPKYPRVANAHGMFEVVYGGAAGAMQPMGRRFTQDEILKIIAYVESLGSS